MDTTELVIFTALLAVGLYDAYVVFTKGVGSSVSRAMERLGFKSPLAVFVVGAVIGHFWFGMKPACECPSESFKTSQETVQEIDRDCLGPLCR